MLRPARRQDPTRARPMSYLHAQTAVHEGVLRATHSHDAATDSAYASVDPSLSVSSKSRSFAAAT